LRASIPTSIKGGGRRRESTTSATPKATAPAKASRSGPLLSFKRKVIRLKRKTANSTVPPLTMTYLRAAAISMIVFSVYYGFAQWLQSAAGSWLTGGRTKGLRPAFLISIGAHLLAGDAACLRVIGRRSS
jgi:hypothetical protein